MKEICADTTRIGWIGVGVMGGSMCSHLLEAGYQVTVTSRTRSKAEPLMQKGAQWQDTATKVAAASDVVFSMTGFPHETREALLGELGALSGLGPGTVLVDMATGPPSLAVEVAAAAAKKQVAAVDAPVSGGDIGARQGTLSIMAGGDAEVVESLQPLWSLLGNTVGHQGGPGSGQHTKMVNQILIAANMVGVCEALVYAEAAGLNLETVMESVASGAAGSWSLSNLGRRMMDGDDAPGFLVEHFVKDLGIAVGEAEAMHLKLPGLALSKQLYQALKDQGHGRSGTQSLIHAVAKLSGRQWESNS